MQTRKITIYQTKNQSKKTIMTDASTLAELKAACRENGIDYDGMTWFEGTSKVELKNDESVLPHDVPFKGQVTNELVFMLTNTNKKIRSGAMTRMEAYAAIKKNNLQATVQEKLGKNFTMCKTADLILIVENTKKPEKKNPVQVVEIPQTAVASTPSAPATPVDEFVDVKAREAITKLTSLLEENGTLEYSEYEAVLDILGGEKKAEPTNPESSYSSNEIEDMFSGWAN